MKVAVIGAGSTYTPELVSGLAARSSSTRSRCTTSTPERLEVVGGLAAADARAARLRAAALELTGDLDRALDGADFVLVQIRVGGQAARLQDETLPLACGCIGQETTGAGGLAKALRTVPVVLEIAERARELRGARRVDRRLHEPGRYRHAGAARRGSPRRRPLQRRDRLQRAVRRLLGVEPRRVVVDQVGLNHLTWVRARAARRQRRAARAAGRARRRARRRGRAPRRLLHELGAVPSYYLRYFYAHDEVSREQLDGEPRARDGRARSSASCSSSTATRR